MLSWSKIDTVLRDMDGMLIGLHFDNALWLYHRFKSPPEGWLIHQPFNRYQETVE